MRFKKLIAGVCASVVFLPSVVFATNGYFQHGYGSANKALAGSGSANPHDALAAAGNVAGLVWVGSRFDITAELLLIPDLGYKWSAASPLASAGLSGVPTLGERNFSEEVWSEKHMFGVTDGYFILPGMAVNKMIDDKSSMGFALYGAGIGTDYNQRDTPKISTDALGYGPNGLVVETGDGAFQVGPELDGTFFDGRAGSWLLLLNFNFSYSRKLTDDLSVGVGFILAAQQFKVRGLDMFRPTSSHPSNVNRKGPDLAIGQGFTAGFQWNFVEDVTVALSYSNRIKMVHQKYKGLLSSSQMDVPQHAVLGVAVKTAPTSTFTADVQWIDWSNTGTVGNKFGQFNFNFDPSAGPVGLVTITPLGEKNGPGFGWEDSVVYKMGYEWKFDELLPDWTFRVGASHQNQIVEGREAMFNILAPAVLTDHFTGGFTWDWDKQNEISFASHWGPTVKVKGAGESTPVKWISMGQMGFEVAWGYKF